MIDKSELAGAAVHRSALYWVLAQVFLTRPDETFLEDLRRSFRRNADANGSHGLAAALAAIGEAVPDGETGIDELAVEHTRLFGAVSPAYGPPPPYKSEHRPSQVPAELAAAVSAFYAAAGLAPDDDAAPPDHLGTELKFLALLCHEEAEAWRAGATGNALGILQQERGFLDAHLMPWAPAYLATVEANARHPLYGRVAALAAMFITEDECFTDETVRAI